MLGFWTALVMLAFGIRVVARMAAGVRGTAIVPTIDDGSGPRVSVIVPVLDEALRIEPCLRGLLAAGPSVGEILVVDGGSRDETVATVRRIAGDAPRVRVIDAAPVPEGWNGKAWGLECGLRASDPEAVYIATIDADVRPTRDLFASMTAHAARRGVRALSVATMQEVVDDLQAVLHPAMLTTLVYRFGLPGLEARRVGVVQANGQCFLAERSLLFDTGVFADARASRCEDVTMARALVAAGTPVGFYEAGALVAVRMHDNGRETWTNWPRSLTMRDRFSRAGGALGLLDVIVVQALPLPLLIALGVTGGAGSFAFSVAAVFTIVRFGVLAGTRRAYVRPPLTYWLSPLADLPVAVALVIAALRRRHVWRGRTLILKESPS